MRPGLPSSAPRHAALLAWILFGFPGFEKREETPAVDAMPIEFVPIATVADLKLGQKTAKPKDEVTPKDIAKAAKEIATLEKKLANPQFLERAPEEVVAEQRARLADEMARKARLEDALAQLG